MSRHYGPNWFCRVFPVAFPGRLVLGSRKTARSAVTPGIGAATVGTGGDWFPTFRLGTNNVLVPNLLAVVFFKARNFTASRVTRMQDLASEFSKKIFRG